MKGDAFMYMGRVYGKRKNGETILIGVVDLKAKKFISIEDEAALAELKQSVHNRLEAKVNEMLNLDPTIPFVYADDCPAAGAE